MFFFTAADIVADADSTSAQADVDAIFKELQN